jgi:co-chaperonin GroES (HSP10)
MQNQGFLPDKGPLVFPEKKLVVPKKLADERNVEHSVSKQFFRLKGFRPTHDFVLLETLYDYQPPDDVTIHIPQAIKNKQNTSRVIAVGDGGMMPNGVINKPCCKAGDLVFVATGNYPVLTTSDAPDREFKLVHDSAILGIFGTESESASTNSSAPLDTTEP